MRNLLCLLVIICIPSFLHAQVKWDGEAANGLWNDPLNWDTDMLPAPGDEVLLDHSHVVGHYTVILPDGNTPVLVTSLEISPSLPDSIFLILPAGNTAQSGFQATKSGDAIIIKSGAVFINASGAASGTPVSVNSDGFFKIENGGHYIHRTERGHTMGLVSRLSQVVGTESGIFEFDVPRSAAYTVSVSNRVYGHLIFSANAAGGSKTYTGAGINPFTIQSQLHLKSGATLSYGNNVNTIFIAKNCIIDTSATFNISNGSNSSIIRLRGNLTVRGRMIETGSSTDSRLVMEGESQQNIYVPGDWSGQIGVEIDNQHHVVLYDSISISGRLSLLLGKLIVAENALILMQDGSEVTNASEQSFVDGKILKIGASPFLFPVGRGEIYAPIGMLGSGAVTDTFTAAYYRNNPQTTSGIAAPVVIPVNHISQVEYWQLYGSPGATARHVYLFAGFTSFVQQAESMLVVSRENNEWVSKGLDSFTQTVLQSPWISGFAYASEPTTSFQYFTLGTTASSTINPLPVRLEQFTVRTTPDGTAYISWRTSGPLPSGTRLLLRRTGASGDRYDWDSLLLHTSSSREYHVTQILPGPGIYHYQLQVTEPGQLSAYSDVRRVYVKSTSQARPLIYPNPIEQLTYLRWNSGPMPFHIRIKNAGGQVVQQRKLAGEDVVRNYLLDFSTMPAGWYWIELSRGNIPIAVLRVLRR